MTDKRNGQTPIESIMSTNVCHLPETATVADAARSMRDRQVGDILVTDSRGKITGIVTDRDIVVRAVAEDEAPAATKLGDICSRDVSFVSPDQPMQDVVGLMVERSIRRVPVVEEGKPVGILSLGDLAERGDPSSVLGQLSGAPPNN